jgi:hypothetical protein
MTRCYGELVNDDDATPRALLAYLDMTCATATRQLSRVRDAVVNADGEMPVGGAL